MVKVDWYCGHYYGLPQWYGDHYEPEECGETFTTEESEEDWAHGYCSAKCPRCHNVLTQAYDSPERQDQPDNQ